MNAFPRRIGWIAIALFSVVLTATPFCFGTPTPSYINIKVDWPSFLSRQDPVWEKMPTNYFEGPFVGNGLLGTIVYQDNEKTNSLRFELGRTDVYDHDGHPGHACRLPIGQLLLTPVGKITGVSLRTDLWNAEITGTLTTDAGTITLRCFVPSGVEVIAVTSTATGREGAATWSLRPEQAMNPRVKIRGKAAYGDKFDYTPNPPFQVSQKDGLEEVVQPLLDGSDYATAWSDTITQEGVRVELVAIANRWGVNQRSVKHKPVNASLEDAVATIQTVQKQGVPALEKAHRAWWHAFYPASFLTVPDVRVESFYWQQLYKLASATRPDLPPIDLMGPWYKESVWAAYWTNLNSQLSYYLFNVINHPDFNEPQSRLLEEHTQDLIDNIKPEEFRVDSATLGNPTIYGNLRAGMTIAPGAIGHFIALPWFMQQFYLHALYTGDEDRLRRSVFPLLVRTMNTYLHVLTLGADGRYHVPLAYSDEYGTAVDTNLNLALIRWCARTLIGLNDRYGLANPLRPRWQEVLDKLVDYQVDPATGLMIGKDVPLAKSHRHSSHMFAIFPFYVLNIEEQPQAKPLIEQSVRHFTGLVGDECLYKFSAASSIWSAIGNGEESLKWLQRALTIVPGRTVTPNTLYAEGKWETFESPISIARSLTDMLLQSWGGVIRVFPSMPAEWMDTSFYDLRTEGAFLVSARREGGRTLFIGIKSLAGEHCRIRTDLAEPIVVEGISDPTIKHANGLLELDIKKGEEAVLYTQGTSKPFVIGPLSSQSGKVNAWGVKKTL